jgi:hypothetical protein
MGIVFGDYVSNFMRVEYPFDFRLSNPEFTLSVYPENIATVMYVATAIVLRSTKQSIRQLG